MYQNRKTQKRTLTGLHFGQIVISIPHTVLHAQAMHIQRQPLAEPTTPLTSSAQWLITTLCSSNNELVLPYFHIEF